MIRPLFGGLLAAFLFAWPAFGASYYVDDAGSGSTCSFASPCDQVADVNALTLSGGDFVYFDCSDTFTDAELNLNQSGTSGNPITVQGGWDTGGTACTGSNDPILGSTNDSCIDNDTDWIEYHDLACTGGHGNDAGDNAIRVLGSNVTLADIDVVGEGASQGGSCLAIGDGADNGTVTNFTFDECSTEGILWNDGSGWTMTDVTCDDTGQWINGDCLASNEETFSGGANNTITRLSCDDQGTNGENCIDIKSGSGWVFSELTCTDAPSACVLVQQGDGSGSQATVTIQDSTLAPAASTIIGQVGVGDGDTSVLTIKRSIWDCSNMTTDCIRTVSTDSNPTPTLNIEESVFYVDSGATLNELIELREGAIASILNSAIISENGNTATELIDGQNDFDGSLTVKNSILYSTCTTCFLIEVASGSVTVTLDNNLYEMAGTGDWIEIITTGYNESEVISSLDGDGDTGDPNFTNLTTSSDLFAMLEPGSPGIGLGAAANLSDGAGTTDLLGYPFNGTSPNAGARSQRIQIRGGKDKPDKPTKTAMACECVVDDIRNSRFILACECVQ